MGFMFSTPSAPPIDPPQQAPAAVDEAKKRDAERRRLYSRAAMTTRDLLINPSLHAADGSGLSNPR